MSGYWLRAAKRTFDPLDVPHPLPTHRGWPAASLDALRQARSDRITEQGVKLFFGDPAQPLLFAAKLVLLPAERVLLLAERILLAAEVLLLTAQGLGVSRRVPHLP